MNLGIKWLWKDTSKIKVDKLKKDVQANTTNITNNTNNISRNTTNITNNANNISRNTTNITNNTNNISRNTNSINTLNTNTAKKNEANTFTQTQTMYGANIGGLWLARRSINYSESAGPLIALNMFNNKYGITIGNNQSSSGYTNNFTFNLNRNVIEGVNIPATDFTNGSDIVNRNYVDYKVNTATTSLTNSINTNTNNINTTNNTITALTNRINQLEQQLNSKLTVNGLQNITYITKIVNMPPTQNTSVVLANGFEVGKVISAQIWFKRGPNGPWMCIPNQNQTPNGSWPGTLEVEGAGGHGQLTLWRQANTSTTLWTQCKLVMLYNGTINWRRGI